MSDFKLDDNIPLPEPDPSEELDNLVIEADDPDDDDEDPEVPGKRGRKPRCSRTDKHAWEEINDTEEKCRLCSEVFPCRNEAKCWHYDCWEKRGKAYLHPWILNGTMVVYESKKTSSDVGGDREAEAAQEERDLLA